MAIIKAWIGTKDIKDKLAQVGHKDGDKVEEWDGFFADELGMLYDVGLNVMLYHNPADEDKMIIFVDTKRFSQG